MADRLSWMTAGLLLVIATAAGARSNQTEYLDGHIVRCNTINTATLTEASLGHYDLQPDAGQGLLICLVQEDQQRLEPENVPASVRARYRPMGQAWRELPMRAVEVNGLVSYLGVYPVDREATLRFEVRIDVPRVGSTLFEFDDLEPAR